jgi:autotransporter-associated beta strand protein
MKTPPRDPQAIRTGSPVLTKLRKSGKVPVTSLLLACFSAWTLQSPAVEGFWDLDANGNWTGTPSNWVGGIIPNGVGDVANFRTNLTANRVLTLNAPVTLGGIRVGDSLGGSVFTFAGTNALTFDNGALAAFFSKFGSSTDIWQAPLILGSDLAWNLFAGIQDVNGAANASVSYTGSGDTIKNGAGTLRLNLNTGLLGTGYTGDWVMNLGTLNVGGPNTDSSFALGTGTGGILLNGNGRADLTIFSLNNNGTGSDSLVTYQGNNDVIVQGAARLNVDRNFISGANDRVTHVLDQLTFRGGILQVTSGNSHNLRIGGTTTLGGAQNILDVGTNGTVTRANLELIGDLVDGGVGGNLVKEGAGRLHLQSATNNYRGITAVRNGVLSLGPGAKTGSGGVLVNGGTLSVPNTATLNGVSATTGGLNLVAQLGTSRYILPVVGYYGLDTIDGSNPFDFQVPVAGAIFGIDGMSGTVSESTASIDMGYVAGGSERVWFGNVTGGDRFFRGTLFNSANSGTGDLRITSGGNTLVFDTNDNALGGAGAMNNLVFGFDHQNAIGFTGNNVAQAATGTVSVRINNSSSLGSVTVNRGVTVNINGAITSPLGAGQVTALGGAINTDNASLAQFGNTDFRLFGGSSLTLDNGGVTTANSNRRLQLGTEIDLTSSTLRLIGDGGAATVSTQAIASLDFAGGSTVSIDTDGTTAGRLTTLTTGSLNRMGRGTLLLRNIANQATTFGTAAGTQKLLITAAPTVTNDMIGANIVLWGGANAADSSQPLFTTYDPTHGVQAAAFDVTTNAAATLAAATADQIVDLSGLTATMSVTTGNVQALRIRSTSNSNQSVNNGTISIGSAAAAGQGAGLYLAHTSDNEITHTTNFTFAGGQEGLLYIASTGGGSSIVRLNGNLTGSNGLTLFGEGRLRLGGNNNFGGPLTINSGDIRLTSVTGAGPVTGSPTPIHLWGGTLSFGLTARHNNDISVFNDARLSSDNIGGTGFNNLTIEPRVGSAAPVVLWNQNVGGGNVNTAYGSLTLNGDARLSLVHPLQINRGLAGTGNLERHMNERLYLGGDSSGYSGSLTAFAGSFQSLNADSAAKPFGVGAITMNPGSTIRIASPGNLNAGQLTVQSDLGGISSLGMSYVGDPAAIPALAMNSTAPWRGALGIGAFGFSAPIDQSTLWGGDVYLASILGDTGVYTGVLSPASGNRFLLGTGQGTIRIGSTLSGAGTSAILGVSMAGENSARAGQVVNNSGGTVQYDVPMTYTGRTVVNPNLNFRISSRLALSGTGELQLNGGTLQLDVLNGQARMIAPYTLSNPIVLTGDSVINIQNEASDLRLTGPISLSPGETGAVRQIFFGVDQPGAAANNAGNVYADGGIIDGAGGSGNHFIKAGAGTLFLTGNNTFSGSLTVSGGLVAVNAMSDFGNITSVNLASGGLAVWENSFTLSRNLSVHGGNGWFDVLGGLTLTQSAGSTIDGTSFIMKRGLGTLVLDGTNSQTGLWIGDGVLQVNSQASLGNPAEAGGTAIQFGGDQTIGGANNGTRYTGGTLRANFTGATNRGIAFNNNGNTAFGGGVDVTSGNVFTVNGVISQGSEFDFGFLTGAGTLATTGNNTWRQFAITNGTLQFSNNTPWANSTGTAADNTVIELLGGTIRALNTAANIALANGASTTTYNYGGGARLRMGSGAAFSVELAADNLLRVNQGTLVIETEGSTLLGGSGATNAARLLVTNAINSGTARGSALTNGIFAAHLIGANEAGEAFFLQDNATNGFEAYAGPSLASLNGLNPNAIGNISAPQLLSGQNSIYAFRTSADIDGGTIRLTAVDNLRVGGILINGSNTISSHLVFDAAAATAAGAGTPGEALVYVKPGESASLTGNVTANAFTKFGGGTLVLGGNNFIGGDLSVQQGIVRLSGSNPLSVMNTELNLNAGAALDLNGTRVSVETLGNNNRAVTGNNAQIGGAVTNSSATASTLAVAGPLNSVFNGTLNLNLRLVKEGAGVLTLNGYSASSPEAGNNTFSGGVDLYGINTTGGLTLNNTTFGLGGFGGSATGEVSVYSGSLNLLYSNGNTGINGTHGQHFSNQIIKIGAEAGDGVTLNIYGPGQINVNVGNVSSNTQWGRGNIFQVGAMNLSNATLNLTGGNFYRVRAAGPIAIQGSQAAFNTLADGPSGALELFGQITGAGAITKFGDGALRGIVIANPTNTYRGGTNIVAGDVQVTATSGTALGTGAVRVFPDGTLRIAGNGSVDGTKLNVMSRVNALGAVMLDDNFNPTVLNSSNFSSVYNTTLQLGVPYFNQPLDLATIGDGRAFLGSGLSAEVKYMAPTLGAGVADSWNPGVGVYRLVGGVNNLAFDGVDNVLTGNNFLQVGPQRNMVLGAATNTGNAIFVRNTNNFSGGTQIAEATVLIVETGGSPDGARALGTGAIEVYGELRVQNSLGSLWDAASNTASNTIHLRPAGLVRLIDGNINGTGGNLVAGNQGRWGDAVGIDLNGGQFRLDGAGNWNTVENIGDVTVRKGGILTVARNSVASSAQLNVGALTRADRGTLTINYNAGFLGINTGTPLSFERLTATSIGGVPVSGAIRGGTTTNGAGVVNGGMVAPWIVDRVSHSHVGYDPTAAAGTGFQPLLSAAPGSGQLSYSNVQTTGGTNINLTSGLAGGTATVSLNQVGFNGTAAITLQDNPNVFALRVVQSSGTNNNSTLNINTNGASNTITIAGGGLILGSANASGGSTYTVVMNPNLVFGSTGTPVEGLLYVPAAGNGSNTFVNGQITADGLTKFGPGQVNIQSINPNLTDPVVINEGTVFARLPFSGSGASISQVFNSQDVILNAGALVLEPFIANAAGTLSDIASPVRAQALFDSNVFVRGDATLGNNGNAQYARLADLTIANAPGAPAMNGNGVISLVLQSGLWVRGTTTLAPEARINSTFNGFSQSTLAGKVTGTGGIQKFGNGAITVLDGTNDYSGGTIIWGTTIATAVSTVASGFRGTGTPFGSGDIQIQPGGLLRLADNANIASNAVYLRSDSYGLGGLALAHNQALDLSAFITSGTPAPGQIKVESTGPFAGVIGLDYGYYGRALDLSAIPGGDWWLGNSTQVEAFYFNPTLGASAGGKYLLGGGGNQSGVTIGSILVNAGRTSLFENVIGGGTPGQVRVEIGAQTGDFTWNSPSFVNGNSGFIALTTRNTGLVGDVRVNTNTTLAIGNNFALGSGRLVVNGGNVRYDFGNNNFITTAITLNNEVVLQGDYNAVSGGDAIWLGNVAMSDVAGAGATRNFNINTGTTAIRGVVSGARGSNLIKVGAGNLLLSGANTYEGYTQASAGFTFFAGNVASGVAGPFGVSDSAVIMAGGSLRAMGRLDFSRNLIVNNSGTFDTSTHNRVLFLGGISVASGQTLSVGAVGADVAGFRGGQLEFSGPISGAGALTVGTTAAAPAVGGTVAFLGNSNGYGINTYSGGTTLQSARVRLGGSTYFAGPANNPTAILSGPLGTGPITFAGGESNRGTLLEASGGPVIIANALNAISHANSLNLNFGGTDALTFTRDLNLNSDGSLRTRSFVVQNLYEPVTFSGNITNSGAQGSNLVKTGPGTLVLTGTNTQANLLTTDTTNYGTGVFIDAGILRVNSNAALGSTATLAAAGPHLAGPADVRLRGGYLSVTSSFSTDRQFILTSSNGGLDVSAGQTLTLTKQTAGVFNVRKVGEGTLMLDNSANTIAALTIGGGQQLNPSVGFTSHRGGVVATTATGGTPFATSAVTIEGGALALIGGAAAQALVVPTVNYGANGAIALFQGATTSQLIATALTRQGAFNSVNFGTLTVVPSSLANLGVTERLLTNTASLNTATGGGNLLTVPSVFVRLQAPGSDANFARHDVATGIREHDVATVTTLATTAAANVADVGIADVAGSGNIDVQAIRTSASITPADGTTLVRLARGGLILNGNSGVSISAPLLFGTNTGASLTEAIVYTRENQAAASVLSGGILARDFTKAGPGLLEIGGSGNLLNTNAARLPVLSVQDGTLRFASLASVFQNQNRTPGQNALLGSFALNVNDGGVFDLNGLTIPVSTLVGNGTVTSNVAGPANLIIRNGAGSGSGGDTSTFIGRITDGAGAVSLTRSGNGVLVLAGHSDHTGGTFIEAGRILNGTGSATGVGASAAALSRLEAQTVTALGSSATLQGGVLRLNSLPLLGGGQGLSQVDNAIDYLLYGGPSGLDLTVSSVAFTNGIALPENRTSFLNALTNRAGINRLTVDAPQLTFTEGEILVNGTATFSQANTVLRLAGGTVWMAGKVDAAGNTLTKTGANSLVLINGRGGAEQNEAGLWRVYGGNLQVRASSGSANPLGVNPTVEINGGSTAYGLQLLTDADGTGIGERVSIYADTTLRFGSMLPVTSNAFVSSGAGRINADRAFLANSSFKTLDVAGLEVGGALGSPYVYALFGNNASIRVNGPTTFLRDMVLQVDGGQGLVLNGPISGNGSFTRRANTGNLFFNGDSSGGYRGGTFLVGNGANQTRNYLGEVMGHQVTLSNTAKLGAGHIYLGPSALFQINDAGNLQSGQNIYVSSNLNWMTNFSLAADLSLEQVRLRALGLGGIQNAADGYYRSASNPSSAILSLGTVYTQPIDMRSLGDGMWYLGSATNGVGANGAYDAATLAPGLGNTYRLGAGGNTLFFGTNGNANVLTDHGASSHLVVGTPMSVQNMAPLSWGTGAVVLLQNQDYTGSTLVNWQSTLDFRGTMKTSGFNVYGTLNVAGEAGTFIHPDTNTNLPVTLRPGSLLRFDNTTAGVLPVSATQGRWKDDAPLDLRNGVLRLQGNAAVEVVETVGAITAGNGGNRLEVVRGVIGRGTELRTPSITRSGSGTLQFIHNGSQLGSDERVIITGTAPVVTNGMVDAWMMSASDQQFVTYNADLGFTIAGFDRVQAAATHTALLNATANRTLFTGNQTMNGGDVQVHAARLDADVVLTTATAATNTVNRLIINGSNGVSGLIAQSGATRTIQGGLWAGAAGDQDLVIYNAAVLNIGLLANNTTSGRIRASSITKTGAGTFQILSEQPDFLGDFRVQQGALQFQWDRTLAGNLSTQMGGARVGGNNIYLEGNNTSLILRIGNDGWTGGTIATFNNNIVLGDHVSLATINSDRAGGGINTRRMAFNNLTFGQNEGDNGQVLRLVGTNAFGVQINGTTTLVGRSAIAVDNAYNGSAADAWLMGRVTGSGMLIKGPSDSRARNLHLHNETTLNDYTGGTVLQGGTLQVFARSNNLAANTSGNIVSGGLGSGDITLMQGTLDIRLNNVASGTATDTNVEFPVFSGTGAGPNVFVNGSSAIFVDRISGGDGANKHITFGNLTIGSQVLTMTAGNTYGLAFAGTTNLLGNAHFNFGGEVVLGGAAGASGTANSITAGGGQVLIHKVGTGTLWVHSANNALNAPVYINSGGIDFGNRAVANTSANLGTGTIFVNPNADLRIRAATNINTALGQDVVLTGTPYSPASLRMLVGTALNQSQIQAIVRDRTASVTSNENIQIVFEGGTLNQALDQSTIGTGRVHFANVGDRTYNAASLVPGLANLPGSVIGGTSTNRVYRLGGRTTNTLTVDLAGAGNLNDVGGATDLQIGSLANLGASGNWGLGQVLLNDQNTYTGQTIVSRGSFLRFSSAADAAGTAGPLGNPSAAAPVHVHGTLRAEGTNGSFVNATNTGNAYTNILLHPGSELRLQDTGATGTAANRWHDAAPIALNGALLTLQTPNTAALVTSETVGALSFERGSRVQPVTQNTAQITLTLGGINRVGNGTLMIIPSAVNRLGIAPANNSERILVSSGAPANVTGTNMLPGYFGVQVENRFATYDPTHGFRAVADAQMATYAAGLPATAIVNMQGNTALVDNPTIFALRLGAFTLNSLNNTAGNDSTVTFARISGSMGGIIMSGAGVINPDLRFADDGTGEALINTVGGNLTLNGNLTAGRVTKFGANTFVIANDQSDMARGIGNGYAGGWVVNEGNLQFNTFGSAGNAAPSNTITLNGNQLGAATLLLRASAADSLLNYTYTSGRIISYNNGNIDWDPAADDRVHSIGDIEIRDAIPGSSHDSLLRVAHNRNRSILSAGRLILTDNGILNVDTTAGPNLFQAYATASTYLTNGISSGMSVSELVGTNRLTKWGDGYLYVRGASPSFSGTVVIDQGAVQVTHNNSLGSGPVTVNRYGVLDIGVAGYAPTNSSLTYHEGSVERWSVNGARSGAVNLGKATLQIAADQPTTSATITLDGGGIEAWLRSDDHNPAHYSGGVMRVLNPNVAFNLVGNSFVGARYYLGANGLDMGKQTHDNRPMEEFLASGAILEIQGAIGGVGGLTKAGYDTVILSGLNTYAGTTFIEGGKLMIGADDALPTGTTLSTTSNGVLDLNGQNQTVGILTNPVASTSFNVTSGFITNSGTSNRTLTAGNGVSTNFSYAGVVQHNVSLAKIGTATMTLTNDNTYLGTTTVNGGVLQVAGRLSGTSEVVLNTGGRMLLNSSTGANDIVNTSADVVFNGGALDLDDSQSNKTQTFKDLSVLGLSELDFGAGSGNTFLFDKLAALIDVLKVYNWSGTPYPISATADSGLLSQDRLLFRSNPGFTANTAINNIVYYNNSGVSYARGLQVTDGVNFGIVPTTMPVAYWTGGIAGNAWNTGNWSSDLGGTNITGTAPDGTTDVVVSAQTQTGKDDMVLGENMQVNSLTVNNSVPGTPVVLQGTGGYTLTINAPSAINISSGAPATTVNTPVQFAAGTATVAVDSTNGLVLAGPVGGAAVTKAGAGSLVLTAANAYTGATNINGGTLQIGNGGSTGTIQTASAITVASGATFSVNRSNAVTQGVDFSSAPISGAGSFRQAGTGTTELNAANTYTGGTRIDGGTLRLSNAQAIGTTGNVSFGGGTLQHTAGNTVDYSSRIANSTAAIRIDTNGQNVSFAGNLAASNTGGLVKSGAGTLTLAGTNSFSGATTVQGGTLSVSSETNLGTAPGAPGAAHLNLNGGTLQTTASFAIDDTNRGVTIGAAGATIDTATGTSLRVENAIVLSGNLTKAGGGALLVNGTSTGTGTVSVTAGTLGGDGVVSGSTTIGTGATLTAGTAGTVASLSFSDDLSVGAGSTWLVDFVAGAADFVSVGDTLNLGGALSVIDDNSWTPLSVYNIASFSTLGGFNRFSNAFNDGDRVGNFTVNYGTVNSGYITLTAVPEPGTLGLLGLALGGFFFRRLRKRRSEVVAVATAEPRE